MPTYDYACPLCERRESVFQSIHDYVHSPIIPSCCGPMERRLSVVPAMSGLANALAGDRHYENLRGPQGEDLSSRSKHREFLKKTGLTDASDYKNFWAKKEAERTQLRTDGLEDKGRKAIVTEEVTKAVLK